MAIAFAGVIQRVLEGKDLGGVAKSGEVEELTGNEDANESALRGLVGEV
ncbi:MAG: hypothetical protein Q7K57_46575 [Burkholderiaceae bacterium]|nr:hypothetical protein [Burkholderiaceae bacterium]